MVNPEETFKECENCHSEKLLVEFPKSRDEKEGFGKFCKKCYILIRRSREETITKLQDKNLHPKEYNILNDLKISLDIKFEKMKTKVKYKTKRSNLMYKLRLEVLKRDKYKCVLCLNKNKLHVHHIIPFHKNKDIAYETFNLVTLCKDCHKRVHLKSTYEVDEDITYNLNIYIKFIYKGY